MRILTLINMNPRKFGALEQYALEISVALQEKGHRAYAAFRSLPPAWLLDRFTARGIKVFELDPSQSPWVFIRQVRDIITRHRIDILHATFYPIHSPVLPLALLGTQCRLIHSDQESRTQHSQHNLLSVFRFLKNRLCHHFIKTIVADAEFIKRCQIKDHFTNPGKLRVIYNGVDLRRFQPVGSNEKRIVKQKLHLDPDQLVLVSIAQCIEAKGLNYLLDAAKIVFKTCPNAVLLILGDGPEKESLEKQAKDLSIENKVIFMGIRVDTETFLSIADIFVLPSVWEEAFAFSLLEAMASGCPVVSSRTGAIPESVVHGVTGLLVPPRNPDSMARAIEGLLENADLRKEMSRAARERVQKHFSMQNWINQTITLYEEVSQELPSCP